MNEIALHALFSKATTTVDGGWSVTFSLLQSESQNIAQLSALRDKPLMLVVMTTDSVKLTNAIGQEVPRGAVRKR